MAEIDSILDQRRAGVLLHITSLPSSPGNGDLGQDAHRFVDLIADLGLTVWQTLPIGPTHTDRSPYQCMSAHAGNPLMISLPWLIDRDLLTPGDIDNIRDDEPDTFRLTALRRSFQVFQTYPEESFFHRKFRAFCAESAYWLDDYALYAALRAKFGNRSWQTWQPELRDRHPDAIQVAATELSETMQRIQYEQFVFFCQWEELRRHANSKGVLLFGDMPIFVAADSAEVWADRANFDLDEQGDARVVAGVPPDYFSATGQRWGNPHYNWERMQDDGFRWWMHRFKTQLALYDLIRIDHFRGFEAYWEIPATEETALNGRWVKAPGEALLTEVFRHFGGRSLPLVAENLGIITDEVESMRNQFGIPGMLILQFAFDAGDSNPYLPKNHTENNVVYTGTHDNDTTLSWYSSLSKQEREAVQAHLGQTDPDMPWTLIECAMQSPARLAIFPLQDLLGLGTEARMNTPGTLNSANWAWRFDWSQLQQHELEKLPPLLINSGRSVPA